MIEGVKTKQLKSIPDQRGRLMEMLRCDDEMFIKFGQVYLTTVYPGVVKAWHYHKFQYDNFVVPQGMVQIALYDSREDSPTQGEVNVFTVGVHNPLLVHIPPMVYHGFKNIGIDEAMVINCPTEPYNYEEPDEYRLDAHAPDIPHDWTRRDG